MAGRRGLIRFVGGPWHNRIVPVEWLQYIRVPVAPKADLLSVKSSYSAYAAADYQIHIEDYALHPYVSDHGTRFWQYIHTSLRPDNRRCFDETFPEWKLSELTLLLRLSLIIHPRLPQGDSDS
jgi:hypothetical protein